jgi:hypothetical protein
MMTRMNYSNFTGENMEKDYPCFWVEKKQLNMRHQVEVDDPEIAMYSWCECIPCPQLVVCSITF